MESYHELVKLLEASVKKNGEVPLTNKYLLNILKKVEKTLEIEENMNDYTHDPNFD